MYAVCVRWISVYACGLMCSLVGRCVLKCVAVFVSNLEVSEWVEGSEVC